MVQQQSAVAGDCFEIGTPYLRVLSEAKSIQDVLIAQARLATECGGKWTASAGRMLEISLQTRGELSQWMNDSFNRLSSRAEETAEQAEQVLRQAA
jgi:hypothetical protein